MHHRPAIDLSVFYCLFSDIASSAFSVLRSSLSLSTPRCMCSYSNPFQLTAHLKSFSYMNEQETTERKGEETLKLASKMVGIKLMGIIYNKDKCVQEQRPKGFAFTRRRRTRRGRRMKNKKQKNNNFRYFVTCRHVTSVMDDLRS